MGFGAIAYFVLSINPSFCEGKSRGKGFARRVRIDGESAPDEENDARFVRQDATEEGRSRGELGE